MEMAKLGYRAYLIDYDGALRIHEIEYHVIGLDFYLIEETIVIEPLPPSEGGAIIEDSGVYLEV